VLFVFVSGFIKITKTRDIFLLLVGNFRSMAKWSLTSIHGDVTKSNIVFEFLYQSFLKVNYLYKKHPL